MDEIRSLQLLLSLDDPETGEQPERDCEQDDGEVDDDMSFVALCSSWLCVLVCGDLCRIVGRFRRWLEITPLLSLTSKPFATIS